MSVRAAKRVSTVCALEYLSFSAKSNSIAMNVPSAPASSLGKQNYDRPAFKLKTIRPFSIPPPSLSLILVFFSLSFFFFCNNVKKYTPDRSILRTFVRSFGAREPSCGIIRELMIFITELLKWQVKVNTMDFLSLNVILRIKLLNLKVIQLFELKRESRGETRMIRKLVSDRYLAICY